MQFYKRILRIYEIVDSNQTSNQTNTPIKQASLIALHKPNVTQSNYFDLVPFIKMENHNVSTLAQQHQSQSDLGLRVVLALMTEGIQSDIINVVILFVFGVLPLQDKIGVPILIAPMA